MKLSICKLALIVGTPVILLGYQNCAKLGTDNLLGGSSSFVSSGSTEIASTSESTTEASSAPSQDVSYNKRKTPPVDPMGSSDKMMLAQAWKACAQPAALQADPNGEYVVESCLNLFCQSEAKAVSSEMQKQAVCTALLQVQKSYTL